MNEPEGDWQDDGGIRETLYWRTMSDGRELLAQGDIFGNWSWQVTGAARNGMASIEAAGPARTERGAKTQAVRAWNKIRKDLREKLEKTGENDDERA